MQTDISLPKEKTSQRPQSHGRSHTDDANVTNASDSDKAFYTLRALYALEGCALHRTDIRDGRVWYVAEFMCVSKTVENLEAAREFLNYVDWIRCGVKHDV